MSLRVNHFTLILALVLGGTWLSVASAQTNYYTTNGMEYPVIGQLPGDQVYPDVAISSTGGFVVWQDNITDGSGWGVSARRLDSTLSGTLGTFRVNATGTNDQEKPRVALLKNGGAVFVWQGGQQGFQHIYARFLTPTNTFVSDNDILVNTSSNNFQINPVVTVLNNSNVVVVWASFNQAATNSMQDVYAQVFSQTGQKIGGEFLVNQFISYNQRTPAVTALSNGGFAVAWVSEQQRTVAPNLGNNTTPQYAGGGTVPSVDIYARIFDSHAVALTGEFLVDTGSNPCALPGLAAAADGGFMAVWTARDMVTTANSWDIYARPFSSTGTGGSMVRVNSHIYGDQYSPQISSLNHEYMVVWTSLGQDGSREGVFGQFVHSDSSLIGSEFRVNTTTASQQMEAAVASDGSSQFEVVWTSYTGRPYNFDLFAQRYADVSALLLPMDAPFVYAPFTLRNNVYQPQLQVSWPPLLGIAVSNYEVYVDGAANPMAVVTSNQWTMTAANGLTTNSTHSFAVDYVTTDNRRSPISPSASGSTWSGQSWGGIPFEWMTAYYGSLNFTFLNNIPGYNWPAPSTAMGGGLTLYQVFLSGGNPLDSSTWLRLKPVTTSQGLFINWNTQPGATYRVQVTTDFKTWTDVETRFALGTTDSRYVGGGTTGFYRVLLLRQ